MRVAAADALGRALDDESVAVRRAVLAAVGKSKSAAAGKRVHAIAEDPEEPSEVRTSAIAALGQMCRKDSVALLDKLALRAGDAELPYDRPLGIAALAALAEIHPADLATTLAPLARDKRTPPQVRAITREAIDHPGRCK